MKSFSHVNAKTINEAVKSLKNYKDKAKLIAGGTDLLGTLKDNILIDYPEVIINIKTIPGLNYIKEDAKGLKIGPLAKLVDIADSPIIKGKYKLLAEAAEAVATPQIRGMGKDESKGCVVNSWDAGAVVLSFSRLPKSFSLPMNRTPHRIFLSLYVVTQG